MHGLTTVRARRVRFIDSKGMAWSVRLSTRREAILAIDSREAETRRVPVLVFDSGSAIRALTDFPPDWEAFAAPELEALCGRARPVPK